VRAARDALGREGEGTGRDGTGREEQRGGEPARGDTEMSQCRRREAPSQGLPVWVAVGGCGDGSDCES
jgi:hypothetical protein